MAADLQPEWISCLPSSWSYGVTRDGRVFFSNEEAKSTTWLHPVSGEAVITGHRKTPDLPTGWEEGYTFEGARCFINHNERKVTCKHPVSGLPSQDNCIFVVNEHVNCGKLCHPAFSRSASKVPANEKKERPVSTMSEASNYTGGSDYAANPNSPAGRPSRPSKKIHNFGKRSNSIRRNPSAPVIKRNWLYKQDSTGMKLWKKRWFVLSDLCLFYYRDEKEEGILGSILLPSFYISMLSVDDHINRKYAFKSNNGTMCLPYNALHGIFSCMSLFLSIVKTGDTSQHADILFLHRHSQRDGVLDESNDRCCTCAFRADQKDGEAKSGTVWTTGDQPCLQPQAATHTA
ncbi:pleckstrin homology domain-containing family A member 5-like isoform X15 [Acanthochromis polyacanthus]|uniref:pleckstrin homology domain-containing family A member 5-like isoform X15 n=1 Tax=Acanthochromis polyacanthus TaxID=80966 RepID=UPI002234B3B0|nr:pleckstrin homology domain-containing family A member 5-like isoform X15 [Acanthochromis polyacanthus]